MELLSYGDDVRELKPESLIKEIKETLKRVVEQYLDNNQK